MTWMDLEAPSKRSVLSNVRYHLWRIKTNIKCGVSVWFKRVILRKPYVKMFGCWFPVIDTILPSLMDKIPPIKPIENNESVYYFEKCKPKNKRRRVK